MTLSHDCEACGRSINQVTETVYQRISGWQRLRKTGGTIVMAEREQRFLCRACLKSMDRAGKTWKQEKLF